MLPLIVPLGLSDETNMEHANRVPLQQADCMQTFPVFPPVLSTKAVHCVVYSDKTGKDLIWPA